MGSGEGEGKTPEHANVDVFGVSTCAHALRLHACMQCRIAFMVLGT
jgi:hypothetical protein